MECFGCGLNMEIPLESIAFAIEHGTTIVCPDCAKNLKGPKFEWPIGDSSEKKTEAK